MVIPTRRLCLAALLLLCAAAGCKKDDMAAQPRFETYDADSFFADGASARPLVAGVVPRDAKHRSGYSVATMPAAAGPEIPASIPFPVTREVMDRGQQRFDIYCSVCHGRLGNGRGMIVQRGFITPPSYHVPRLTAAPDSHFFNVISNGFGAMYSYGDRINPTDRWCIVAYIRALQAAPELAAGKLSDEDRTAIRGTGEAGRQ